MTVRLKDCDCGTVRLEKTNGHLTMDFLKTWKIGKQMENNSNVCLWKNRKMGNAFSKTNAFLVLLLGLHWALLTELYWSALHCSTLRRPGLDWTRLTEPHQAKMSFMSSPSGVMGASTCSLWLVHQESCMRPLVPYDLSIRSHVCVASFFMTCPSRVTYASYCSLWPVHQESRIRPFVLYDFWIWANPQTPPQNTN